MGRKEDILAKVRAIAEPLAGPEGLELVDVELSGGQGRTILRFFIDRLRGPDGHALPRPPTAQVSLGLSADEQAAPVVQDEGGGEGAGESEGEGERRGSLEAVQPDRRFEGVSLAPQGAPRGVAFGESVTLDDCTHFSRIVSAALDVEDPLDGAYDLEVSSPGLDRPLRTEEHFVRYAGQKVRVKTYAPVPGYDKRKTFVGLLKGLQDGKVVIDVDGTLFAVPFAQVSRANIEPEYDF